MHDQICSQGVDFPVEPAGAQAAVAIVVDAITADFFGTGVGGGFAVVAVVTALYAIFSLLVPIRCAYPHWSHLEALEPHLAIVFLPSSGPEKKETESKAYQNKAKSKRKKEKGRPERR